MPYSTLAELPKSVKSSLPKGAQVIYKEAYNHAWDQYKERDKRRCDNSREETAHKVAWSAIKKKYEKRGENWRKI